jgi:hypothetical protein
MNLAYPLHTFALLRKKYPKAEGIKVREVKKESRNPNLPDLDRRSSSSPFSLIREYWVGSPNSSFFVPTIQSRQAGHRLGTSATALL